MTVGRTFRLQVGVTLLHDPEFGVGFEFVFPLLYQTKGPIADFIVGGLESERRSSVVETDGIRG